ncbi:ATP-binding cassette domain-containing protein [Lactococcus insecticola]|uniref:Uncharacterized protein n=1 Tax=Pseudolactococcus insecticola TaxID=2709158 RepID=A0A6A0B676_9LACT|nr:ATP-binding cassette domain-containing protein [Lactococcus insecticola]GFH39794.1 hypothetical protein Hs20B_01920 [Lactococcus insecticola]
MTDHRRSRRTRKPLAKSTTSAKNTEKVDLNVAKVSEIAEVETDQLVKQATDKNLKVRASLISKKFELSQNEKFKEVFGIGKDSREIKDFWALRNINFDVYDGEAVGIVGLNGSGKSTLLNIIDKSLSATTGELAINGEVSYIAIGAGLKAGLTGRDNIRLKGTMMGMTKQEINEKMEEIISFSELGPFIDRQVKDYSSGMRSKLAFSIAVNQDPDILIIDEALSVGDSTFAAKSAKKMFEFRERGKTIFVVSHNASQIQKWTDKVIWLHYGEVKEYGPTKDVLPKYQTFVNWFNRLSKEQQEQYKLDRRQEQLDYSVEALKQEVVDNSSEILGQESLEIIDETIAKSKNRAKLSWLSKCIMAICFVFMMFTLGVSVKGGGLNNASSPKPSKIGAPKSAPSTSSSQKSTANSSQKSTASTSKKSSSKAIETFDYVVQDGDTVSGIAAAYGISSDEILKLNPKLDPTLITVGMTLKLPKSVEGKASTVADDAASDTTTADDTTTDTVTTDDTTQTDSGYTDDTYVPAPSYQAPSTDAPAPEVPTASAETPAVETPSVEDPTVETPEVSQ